MLAWIAEHWDEVASAIAYIVTAASIVVKLTPTQEDDRFLARYVLPLLNVLAINPKTKP